MIIEKELITLTTTSWVRNSDFRDLAKIELVDAARRRAGAHSKHHWPAPQPISPSLSGTRARRVGRHVGADTAASLLRRLALVKTYFFITFAPPPCPRATSVKCLVCDEMLTQLQSHAVLRRARALTVSVCASACASGGSCASQSSTYARAPTFTPAPAPGRFS